MNKVKKGLAMVMAYLMLISILPIGIFTVLANAQGDVPKYLNYSEQAFTSVRQYGDKTLVAYNVNSNYSVSNYGSLENVFSQLSVLENGKETKLNQYAYVGDFVNVKDSTYFAVSDGYNLGFSTNRYDFLTEKITENVSISNENISQVRIVFNLAAYETLICSNGDKAYSMDSANNSINEYVLENDEYIFNSTIYNDIEVYGVSKDSNGDGWFLADENGRNFVFKIENGQPVKKYEVASFMRNLSVYDDNNLVVTSEYGSTIINAGSTYNTVETKPINVNENAKTTTVKTGDTNSSRNLILFGIAAIISLGAISIMEYSKFKKNKQR